jgi:hypothetical protein
MLNEKLLSFSRESKSTGTHGDCFSTIAVHESKMYDVGPMGHEVVSKMLY